MTLTGRIPVPVGYVVRLPTEIEWERAARGTDGRVYPWGNTFEFGSANVQQDHVQSNRNTTAVCTYPQGKSPVGACDMAGNAWEWTLSRVRKTPTWVVRGGSWHSDKWNARCANRDGYRPEIVFVELGFRLVLSLVGRGFD